MIRGTKAAVEQLLLEARDATKVPDHRKAWSLLEEAHILSQPFAIPHILVHFKMFCLAVEQRDFAEIFGQTIRLILAAPGSILKKYPRGNTGRSNVSMFQPMPIPEHILERIKSIDNSNTFSL